MVWEIIIAICAIVTILGGVLKISFDIHTAEIRSSERMIRFEDRLLNMEKRIEAVEINANKLRYDFNELHYKLIQQIVEVKDYFKDTRSELTMKIAELKR